MLPKPNHAPPRARRSKACQDQINPKIAASGIRLIADFCLGCFYQKPDTYRRDTLLTINFATLWSGRFALNWHCVRLYGVLRTNPQNFPQALQRLRLRLILRLNYTDV